MEDVVHYDPPVEEEPAVLENAAHESEGDEGEDREEKHRIGEDDEIPVADNNHHEEDEEDGDDNAESEKEGGQYEGEEEQQ